ncbi:aspartate kinase [Persicobacter sp. CCB-QB2]|uniref:aspartate kinase n=1 Tax=Persicobacter sp. CCB-QB2 TaxID=1561025 RepID=UPI0006A95AF5|nr:aspartate kinase [Persicobacter sp. CCB-QB2]
MQVYKFGGTSVGRPERMHRVAELIQADSERKIVVLSALSGTTNALVAIGDALTAKNNDLARQLIEELYEHYLAFYPKLVIGDNALAKAKQIIDEHFSFIRTLPGHFFNKRLNKELLAQGELMSTKLFTTYLHEQGVKAQLLPALDFMLVNEDHEPDLDFTSRELSALVEAAEGTQLFITQGYICRDHEGEVSNLSRGGSDYTATLIGAAIQASETQIWTDIDGMHNNDPRVVENTFPIPELSFDEASELAYFGAKILHPTSIIPAQRYNVPVRLKNTMEPKAPGTLISQHFSATGAVKAVAAKDGITAIKIRSNRMVLAYGFIRQIFEVFEKYKTPIDMITTSEVAVSLTIDNDEQLPQILETLEKFGQVQVDRNQSIVCVVGDFGEEKVGIATKVLDAMEEVPIRMISYGGSDYNISLLVGSENKEKSLCRLNEFLF